MPFMKRLTITISATLLSFLTHVFACKRDNLCYTIDSTATTVSSQILFVRSAAAAVQNRTDTAKFSVVSYDASSFSVKQAGTDDVEDVNSALDTGVSPGSGSGSMFQALLGCEKAFPDPGNRTNICVVLTSGGAITQEVRDKIADMKSAGFKISIAGIGVNAAQNATLSGLFDEEEKDLYVAASLTQIQKSATSFQNTVCNKAGKAIDDPHIYGFDGSRFDFHGVPDQHFKLFGRRGGDLVVCKLRAVGTLPKGTTIPGTYFHEFGFQPAGTNDRLRVALTRTASNGEWKLVTSFNNRVISSSNGEIRTSGFSVTIAINGRVTVKTSEAFYHLKMVRPKVVQNTHLNINVKLLRSPQSSDDYDGVLGKTLNTVIGMETDQALAKGVVAAVREKSLTDRFWVPGLFPPKLEKEGIDVVSRLVSFRDAAAFNLLTAGAE